MSIDLKKLENKLDEALSNETNETLTKFLTNKRMSNNKQSSSVEWLFEELFNSFEKFNNGDISFAEYMAHNLTLREKAKEMYKQEMINFTSDWYHNGLLSLRVLVSTSVEEHYNKTFK